MENDYPTWEQFQSLSDEEKSAVTISRTMLNNLRMHLLHEQDRSLENEIIPDIRTSKFAILALSMGLIAKEYRVDYVAELLMRAYAQGRMDERLPAAFREWDNE